ncbi:Hypothetical predicted protein [Cloeon dipterum]|uniref:Uncharacterized protein n=1 Tax=Cloeon dipterum TaxID=197152 RepID=A0A8S1DCE8_9INSE|nr:Hypothetical predicted protein [Cloeon dipterum]
MDAYPERKRLPNLHQRVDEGRGYFVSNGRVAVAKQYKMLVIKGNSTKFQWYYLREGEYLPPDAFVSGRTYNGSKPVYIGKTTVDGEVLYGRVRQSSVPVLAVAVTRNRRRVDFAYSFYVLVQPGVVGF